MAELIEKIEDDINRSEEHILINQSLYTKETIELRFQIEKKEEELKELKDELKVIYDKHNNTNIRRNITYLRAKQDLIKKILYYKEASNALYKENRIDEKYLGEWNRLEQIFVGNRFCSLYYNDTTKMCGHFMNEGGPDDRSSFGFRDHKAHKDDVVFDSYRAYKLAGSSIENEYKISELNKMFDKMLSG